MPEFAIEPKSRIFLVAVADDGFRGFKVVSDLSHWSGKLGTYLALIIGIDDYRDSHSFPRSAWERFSGAPRPTLNLEK